MELHSKKRLEIIIEAPVLRKLIRVLEQGGAQGYTVVPALAGSGKEGGWSREGEITDAGRQVMVISIVDGSHVPGLVEAIRGLIARHVGILSVSDVEVVRKEHF